MKKILIIGGGGFVGLNLAQSLSQSGFQPVLMVPNLIPLYLSQQLAIAGVDCQFVQGDVRVAKDLDRVCTEFGIQKIIHAAAITADSVRELTQTKDILETNLMGSVEVFECAIRHSIEQVIHFSSGSIFGELGCHDDIIDEVSSPVLPVTIYGISKLAAERTALRYRQNRQLNITVLRLGLVYGRWEYDTGHRDTLSLPYKAFCSARDGLHIQVSKKSGSDYVYGNDIAQGIGLILEAGSSPQGLYHLSSGMTWSIEWWLDHLHQYYPNFSYEMVDDPEQCFFKGSSPLPRSPMSIRRMQEDFSYSPAFDEPKAFEDFMRFHQQINRPNKST